MRSERGRAVLNLLNLATPIAWAEECTDNDIHGLGSGMQIFFDNI
jgi:hypothetical protein